MKAIIHLLFFVFVMSVSAQNQALFKEGNTLYNAGKFNEAIKKYEQILQSNEHSADLYYNLGNAHYKLNNIAPSIFYFEKALLLEPNNKNIKNNLAFAQNMTIDAIDTVPEIGFARLTKNIVTMASTTTWAIIAVAGVIHFVFLFLWYHFAKATTRKRLAFVVSLLSLFLACFALVMAFQKNALDNKNNPAIVFAQETKVNTDPSSTSETLFKLHEGTKVQVLETYENWSKIQLLDNSEGWLISEAIKTLN